MPLPFAVYRSSSYKISCALAPTARLILGAALCITALCITALCITALCITALSKDAHAQEDPSSRLEQGESGKNRYRGAEAVSDMNAVKNNMKQLFDAIIISGKGDSKADKWMSPHLRDILWNGDPKKEEVSLRRQTIPRDGILAYCLNPFNPAIQAACPITVPSLVGKGDVCQWHGEKFSAHRPYQSCFQTNTLIYQNFTTDSNWKICCVDEDQEKDTTEQIVSRYPNGDGWSGLFEFYYPVTALGWENDRTTTMIADKKKVEQCVKDSQSMMENEKAQKWVAAAIEKNLSQASKVGGGDAEASEGATSEIEQKVASIIKEVRPKERKNRFSDSLQSEGLTVRPNLATLDPEYRKLLAQRFCGRPEQFDKIMNPPEDNVQWKGGLSLESLDNLPMWSNYCPKGVNLMTSLKVNRELRNIDGTPTDLKKGMEAWEKDPLYCQRMHLTNKNMSITGFDKVINKSSGPTLSQEQVGHTCLDNDKLNGAMVPLTLNRHAAVERRAAIADHALGFLIAARIATGMREGQKSYLKGFEPQPYSDQIDSPIFRGRRYGGGGTNELVRTDPANSQCASLSGENYQYQNKADRLYISNKTHEPFTQKMIDDKNTIDKYVQGWADSQKEKIANRGLDEKSSNYATAFRIMAMCPAGKVRWKPKEDGHNNKLPLNLDMTCGKENFGGKP
jgi:hypothetical protein